MKNVNSDIAYAHIRKRILSGEYPTGHPLMTNELATEIGVSRTPVRDALRQLEADGLVLIKARIGASVKSLDIKEYREMCGLRLALESYAAGLAAAHRTPDELFEMKSALEEMRQLTRRAVSSATKDAGALEELRRADVRFHLAIIAAAKSDLLKKEVLRLHIVSRVASGPSPTSKIVMEKAVDDAHRKEVQEMHDTIYGAIEKGLVAEAKTAMEHHIQDIVDRNLRILARAKLGDARALSEEELSYTP